MSIYWKGYQKKQRIKYMNTSKKNCELSEYYKCNECPKYGDTCDGKENSGGINSTCKLISDYPIKEYSQSVFKKER
jgi:hypothetical protein